MDGLTGVFEHTIDSKNRLFIPARLREELGESFHLAMGIDQCLAIYPKETWDRFREKFDSLPMSESQGLRPLFAYAVKCVPDSQGRIVIPQELRAYAGLEKKVVITGVSNRAEIWPAELWHERNQKITPAAMAACMRQMGF